ncbi:uncharacterized protein BUCNMO_060 [Buchnera aphidicola (Nipponaphis monzeni)]|uniref:Uncharacterized protein n=1 Tax=Buchnera aphidicola (Nipponaphis monzeni) TaxID=2495405 RepID=A0A455T9S0_9GAMM|nr:flagellar hook-length control protein FliK [Buchnera aphidicola]BBI01079.1 uncharacterized protein BUCNMO_060 [Buchnera aphidicola (Nipponaphis monzeni)]
MLKTISNKLVIPLILHRNIPKKIYKNKINKKLKFKLIYKNKILKFKKSKHYFAKKIQQIKQFNNICYIHPRELLCHSKKSNLNIKYDVCFSCILKDEHFLFFLKKINNYFIYKLPTNFFISKLFVKNFEKKFYETLFYKMLNDCTLNNLNYHIHSLIIFKNIDLNNSVCFFLINNCSKFSKLLTLHLFCRQNKYKKFLEITNDTKNLFKKIFLKKFFCINKLLNMKLVTLYHKKNSSLKMHKQNNVHYHFFNYFQFKLTLNESYLGTIQIKLDFNDKTICLEIISEEEKIRKLLQNNIYKLKKIFIEKGMYIKKCIVKNNTAMN